MHFAHSIWLTIGALTCLLLWVWLRRVEARRQQTLATFAAHHLLHRLTENVSERRRHIRTGLFLAGTALLFVALARPQAGYRWKEVSRKGIDVLFAVDCSKSMLANDVMPDRLQRATLGIRDFVDRLDGDRVGLIPFAGNAFLMCPLTLDYAAFGESLDALNPELLPRGGTDLASAIHEAESAFSDTANHKFLILITDGEDLEGRALDAARQAAERGLVLYTVGVGTADGELVPIDPAQGGGFAKDENGQVIKSRLDEETLRQMAEITGGVYRPLGARAEGLDAIYAEKLSLIPEEEFNQRLARVPVERFEWPLGLAMLLFVVEFLVGDRKSERALRKPVVASQGRRRPHARLSQAAAWLLIVLPLWARPSDGYASPRSAYQAYEKGRYEDATSEYSTLRDKDPEDPRLQFNAGASAYKADQFEDAEGAFREALGTDQLDLQQTAYYNLGNTQFRRGQAQESDAPEQAMQIWQQAVASYDGALKLNPEDKDAAFKRHLVHRKLQQLQQLQQQQEQEQEQEQKQQEENEEEPQQDQQASQGEDPGKDQLAQAGQQQEEQTGQEGEEQSQPSPSPSDLEGEPEPTNPSPQPAQTAPNERRRPGEMTPQEAEQLLDSLKGDEAQVSFMPAEQGASQGDDTVRRDW